MPNEEGAMTEELRQAVAKNLQELYEEESWEVGSRLARAPKAGRTVMRFVAPRHALKHLNLSDRGEGRRDVR